MGLNNFMIGMVLIFIFSIGMINFATYYAIENSAPINIANDSDVQTYSTNSQGSMNSFSVSTNGSAESFAQATISETSQSGTLVTGSPFKSAPKNPYDVFKNAMFLGFKKIFGGDANFSIIYSAIIGLVLTISGFLVWKLWKGGDPE